jgi:phage antirepressor YoqD-like protein
VVDRTQAARDARKKAAEKRRNEIAAAGRALEPVGREHHNETYIPNFADADKVLRAAGANMKIREICALIGVSEPLLRRHYREELDSGHAVAISKVADVAYRIATDINHPKVAQMNQFWLRSRGKWTLNDTLTVTGPDGQPLMETGTSNVIDVSALSEEERDKLREAVEHVAYMRAEAAERSQDDDDRD